jgi:DNA-binding Lrp family transcriptional regulator
VDWCHAHCGEWTQLSRGCAPIPVERIAQALGKSPEEIQRLAREAAELNALDEIFAAA